MDENAEDPRPLPPREPGPFDCCGNECGEACVWTIYRQLQRRHERELDAWLLRQLDADDQG
ncbi:oxidoreductase-like domain-containing protein [Uliginosibacterium paludis]|uniref:Oxidoreductase-like domain-containing protein n=1 Tax=Uliginosibacterium paludis TaxID=1615952 RepID=A0ABV2CNK2_9RHOO